MTIGVCTLAFAAIMAAQNAEWKAAMDRAERADVAGNYIGAVESYRQGLAIADHFGAGDSRTWTSYNRLAIAYQNAGMLAESIRTYRREISMITHVAGKQSTAYTIAIANLATAFVSGGNFLSAENLLREALEIETGPLQSSPLQVAVTRIRLSEALVDRGDYREAERQLGRALPVIRSAGDRFYTAVAINTHGVVCRHEHRDREALDAFLEAVTLVQHEYNAVHPVLVLPLNNLAVEYALVGNAAEADRTFRRAQAICEAALAPAHPSHVALLANYADFLRRTGEKSRAKAMRQQADVLVRDNAWQNGRALTVDVSAFRRR